MQHKWPMQVRRFANSVLDIGAIVGNSAVDIGAAAHQITQLAAETVANRADLAIAFGKLLQVGARVLHILDREVVIEIVVEIERFLDVFLVLVGELDAGFLPPEEVRHETNEASFGKFVGMMAHGVIDAPYLHDRDDRAARRFIWDGDIGAHFAGPQLYFYVSRLHEFPY